MPFIHGRWFETTNKSSEFFRKFGIYKDEWDGESKLREVEAPGSRPSSGFDHIPGYHDGGRPWERNQKFEEAHKGEYVGVEVEVLAGSYRTAVGIRDAANDLGIVVERDSSLNGVRGVEVIGPPIPWYQYGDSVWSKLLPTLNQLAVGWEAGDGYGMHVSLDVCGFEGDALVGFVRTLNDRVNFFSLLSGRIPNFYCNTLNARYGTNVDKAAVKNLVAMQYFSHHSVVCVEGNRVEVRLCRSTVRPLVFMKNVELYSSLRVFCNKTVKNGDHVDLNKYLDWVFQESETFPNLVAWINNQKHRIVWLRRFADPNWANPVNRRRDPSRSKNFTDKANNSTCQTIFVSKRKKPTPA